MKATYKYIIIIMMLILILLGLTACVIAMAQEDKEVSDDIPTESAEIVEPTESTPVAKPVVDVEKVDTEEIKPTRYEYENEAVMLAKLMYREARGIESITEQANVAWTVLNRVDSSLAYYPDTIEGVITQKNQFAWDRNAPTVDDYGRDLVDLAHRIILFWAYGDDNGIHRTLPQGYYYFYGDGTHNHFTDDYDLFMQWCRTKNFIGDWNYAYGYLKEDK